MLANLDKAYGNLLGRDHHMGQIDKLLRSAGVDLDAWTVTELVARLDEKIPYGRGRLAAAKDPLRYFGWMIRHVIEMGEIPRRIAIERRAQKLAAERAELARQREHERQRMAADNPAETQRIITQMHADAAAYADAARRAKRRAQAGLSDLEQQPEADGNDRSDSPTTEGDRS